MTNESSGGASGGADRPSVHRLTEGEHLSAVELYQDKLGVEPTGQADMDLLDSLSQDHDNRSRRVQPPALDQLAKKGEF
jgi:hypothetical protein